MKLTRALIDGALATGVVIGGNKSIARYTAPGGAYAVLVCYQPDGEHPFTAVVTEPPGMTIRPSDPWFFAQTPTDLDAQLAAERYPINLVDGWEPLTPQDALQRLVEREAVKHLFSQGERGLNRGMHVTNALVAGHAPNYLIDSIRETGDVVAGELDRGDVSRSALAAFAQAQENALAWLRQHKPTEFL